MADLGKKPAKRIRAGEGFTNRVLPTPSVPIYEELLNRDPRWALSEGSRHFEEDSSVFKALRNITSRLKGLGIPYTVVGGMALFRHGLRRFTEDVDLLVTKHDLKVIHEKLEGLGYLPPFKNSKRNRSWVGGDKSTGTRTARVMVRAGTGRRMTRPDWRAAGSSEPGIPAPITALKAAIIP